MRQSHKYRAHRRVAAAKTAGQAYRSNLIEPYSRPIASTVFQRRQPSKRRISSADARERWIFPTAASWTSQVTVSARSRGSAWSSSASPQRFDAPRHPSSSHNDRRSRRADSSLCADQQRRGNRLHHRRLSGAARGGPDKQRWLRRIAGGVSPQHDLLRTGGGRRHP